MAGLAVFDGGVGGPVAVDVPSGGAVDRERGAVLRAGAVVEVKVRRRVEVGCRRALAGGYLGISTEIAHSWNASKRLKGCSSGRSSTKKGTSGPTP
jgi:hypothetical protein